MGFLRKRRRPRAVTDDDVAKTYNGPSMVLSFPDWIQTWPLTTDIHCLWCCHSFSTVPIPLPMSRHEFDCTYYRCRGLFCSFNCAKAYAFSLRDSQVGNRCTYLFELLYHMCYYGVVSRVEMQRRTIENTYSLWGGHVGIKPAPDRTLLNTFGGSLSIDQYRTGFLTISAPVSPPPPPASGRVVTTPRWIVSFSDEKTVQIDYSKARIGKGAGGDGDSDEDENGDGDGDDARSVDSEPRSQRQRKRTKGEGQARARKLKRQGGGEEEEEEARSIKKPRAVLQHHHRKRTMDIQKLSEVAKKQRMQEHSEYVRSKSTLMQDFGIEYK